MLSLLPVDRVITVVAVAYAATILLVVAIILTAFPALNPWQTLTVAFSGSAALQLLVFLVFNVAWKWIWSAIPALNQSLFPNIEGKWKMIIHWQRGEHTGQVVDAPSRGNRERHRNSRQHHAPLRGKPTTIQRAFRDRP
jgi:hypothetical protein